LVSCLILLLDIYDFLNKYKQNEESEEEGSLESRIMHVESMDVQEADKLLTSNLKKRGLLLL